MVCYERNYLIEKFTLKMHTLKRAQNTKDTWSKNILLHTLIETRKTLHCESTGFPPKITDFLYDQHDIEAESEAGVIHRENSKDESKSTQQSFCDVWDTFVTLEQLLWHWIVSTESWCGYAKRRLNSFERLSFVDKAKDKGLTLGTSANKSFFTAYPLPVDTIHCLLYTTTQTNTSSYRNSTEFFSDKLLRSEDKYVMNTRTFSGGIRLGRDIRNARCSFCCENHLECLRNSLLVTNARLTKLMLMWHTGGTANRLWERRGSRYRKIKTLKKCVNLVINPV